jgi:hypothetical protein
MTQDAWLTHDLPPSDWAAILTLDEWRTAVRALGFDRLRELRPMICQFSPHFRRVFVGHLADLDGYAPGRRVLLAVARGAHDVRAHGCPCCANCESTVAPEPEPQQ